MKKWLFGFACGLLCGLFFGVGPLFAEELLRIVPGRSQGMDDRMLAVEKAVAQLQRKVYGEVEAVPSALKCRLETRFDGVFNGASVSEVLERCRAATKGGIYCVEHDVHCAH